MLKIIIGYLIVINILGIVFMGVDKYKAKHHLWRIPEKYLFLVSILGGSAGSWFGMYIFHHKTKHWYFEAGMPLILALQLLAAWYLYFH